MPTMTTEQKSRLEQARGARMATPTDLEPNATRDITGAMNALLADVFALYLKTKNFHWHVSGPHFRDYHELLDEQSAQIYAMTDPIAERVRKIGGQTIRSIGHIARLQRITDSDAEYVDPLDMLAELREDNKSLAARLREAHGLIAEYNDVATASLIEAGLVDELRLIVHPLIAGGGRTLFATTERRRALGLRDVRQLSAGRAILTSAVG